MKNSDFCVFILTHGRPDRVVTYNTIRKLGYTGKVFFIIDNEDKTANKYYENFGEENVIMFDKKAVSDKFDEGDNFGDRRTIIYARNVCFEIAEKLGFKYFIELDDDYKQFEYRVNSKLEYTAKLCQKNLDKIFDYILNYYKSINVKSIALIQGGDLIGGGENTYIRLGHYPFIKRKCMNSFICSTERKFQFVGRINEDVNTYCLLGSQGQLFMTIPIFSLSQLQTQSNSGGMTDIYLDSGTYIKSFYSVMYMPSSVKVKLMNTDHKRLHHSIKWINTVPKILDEQYKKK